MIQALTEAALFQPCAGVYRDLSRKKATLKGWQWKFFAKLFFKKAEKAEKAEKRSRPLIGTRAHKERFVVPPNFGP